MSSGLLSGERADTITTPMGSAVAISVLANDLNPDASQLALVAAGGADTFSYTVQDGAFSAEATVTVFNCSVAPACAAVGVTVRVVVVFGTVAV